MAVVFKVIGFVSFLGTLTIGGLTYGLLNSVKVPKLNEFKGGNAGKQVAKNLKDYLRCRFNKDGKEKNSKQECQLKYGTNWNV